MITVFLDANVIFAACHSQSGGSAFIINLARLGDLKIVTSRLALKEAEKNLRIKSTEEALDRFYQLHGLGIDLVESDRMVAKQKFGKLVSDKDAPILASAIKSKANFLMTLDKKHFLSLKVRAVKLPINNVTPGEFIKEYL